MYIHGIDGTCSAKHASVAGVQCASVESSETTTQIGGRAAEHARHVNAAADREIRPCAAPAMTDRQFGLCGQLDPMPTRKGEFVDMRFDVGAAQRNPYRVFEVQSRPGQGDLQRCGVCVIADQQIRDLQRIGIQRAGATDAQMP